MRWPTRLVALSCAVLVPLALADVRVPRPLDTILGVTWDGRLVEIDPELGLTRLLGRTGHQEFQGLAKDSRGRILAYGSPSFGSPSLLEVDRARGRTFFMRHALLSDGRGLAFSPDDVLYAVATQSVSSKLYRYDLDDPTDPAPILIGNMTDHTGQGIAITALAFARTGELYAWSTLRGLVRVDPLTGFCTDLDAQDDPTSEVQTLAFSSTGELFGGREHLYRFDLQTGQRTQIGVSVGMDVRGFEFVNVLPSGL